MPHQPGHVGCKALRRSLICVLRHQIRSANSPCRSRGGAAFASDESASVLGVAPAVIPANTDIPVRVAEVAG